MKEKERERKVTSFPINAHPSLHLQNACVNVIHGLLHRAKVRFCENFRMAQASSCECIVREAATLRQQEQLNKARVRQHPNNHREHDEL
jgi:hypothetical protein